MTIAFTGASPQRIGTRAIFALGGIVLGAWAPLIPVAKIRLGIDEGTLGLLLLCMGVGSIVAMPMTAFLTSRYGCRQVISASASGLCLMLPLLATAGTLWTMMPALLLFGVVMGCTSVAMNLQAVLVERQEGVALMSGFHAMFSLGGIIGSATIAMLLAQGVQPLHAAVIVSVAMAGLLLLARPGLLPFADNGGERPPAFIVPRGVVLAIGVLSLLAMLAEGGVLDWGALFMIEAHDADLGLAGFAYTAFAITMTAGRLLGDRLRTAIGDLRLLIGSAMLATLGFLVSLLVTSPLMALAGFLLVGAGISNIAPILFTLTGRTRRMPANLAVASVLTVGYVGIIAGPAAIGLIAHATSLQTAFFTLCAAMVVIALSSRAIFTRV
ncbi:Fucose permease [Devosia lucknowensis]|uniref:Fucose permease n=1 Tax=Devosia lucknowensis TaxID=1096929 RepID=A0A1Y6EDG3_9HYPH|nr:MFS transporter [Devosia lucknowensis]SMQ58662.1 Fucose permease [Devosia lucknowensis]